MKTTGAKRKWNWPLFIAMLSFIYVAIYGIVYIGLSRSDDLVSKAWSIIIMVAMVVGAVGMLRRAAWAGKLLVGASGLVLLKAIYNIVMLFFTQGPPIQLIIFGVLAILMPTLIWPVLLIVWFFNKPEVFQPGG